MVLHEHELSRGLSHALASAARHCARNVHCETVHFCREDRHDYAHARSGPEARVRADAPSDADSATRKRRRSMIIDLPPTLPSPGIPAEEPLPS